MLIIYLKVGSLLPYRAEACELSLFGVAGQFAPAMLVDVKKIIY